MNNGASRPLADTFLTPKEAATFMRVSMETFYKYLRKPASKGGPPQRRFGRNCIRIPREQFFKWANIETRD